MLLLKNTWKQAVSAVTENAIDDGDSAHGSHRYAFYNQSQDTILTKDLELYCFAHAMHELYSNPSFLMYEFKCQKQNPNVRVWDFMVAKLVRKLSLEFIANDAASVKMGERELYDGAKMRTAFTTFIEDRLMREVEQFDARPDLSDAPRIQTRYEYCAK